MKRFVSLFLAMLMIVLLIPAAHAEIDYTNPPYGSYVTPEDYPNTDLSGYYKVRLYTDRAETPDEKLVVEAINKELMDRGFNTEIEIIHFVMTGSTNMYSLNLASGEIVDVYFSAPWKYLWEEALKGSWYPMDEEFLATYMPHTWETQDPASWKEVTYGGKIIAIPGNIQSPNGKFVAVRQDLMEKYGFEKLESWDDWKKFALTIAEKETPESGIYALNAGDNVEVWRTYVQQSNQVLLSGELFDYSYKGAGVLPDFAEDVKCVWERELFRQFCHEMKELADAGCWSQSALASTYTDKQNFENLTSASAFHHRGLFNSIRKAEANGGESVHGEAYELFPEAGVTAEAYSNNCLTIPQSSGNIERAAMLIDIIRNDFFFFTTYRNGILGRNWEYNEEDNSFIHYGRDVYHYGTIGNALRQSWEPTEKQLTNDTRDKVMEDAQRPRLMAPGTLSFVFDSTPVRGNMAAVNSLVDEYVPMLRLGLVDDVDATLDEFIQRMYDAGLQKVYDEMQSQYEAWLALQ